LAVTEVQEKALLATDERKMNADKDKIEFLVFSW